MRIIHLTWPLIDFPMSLSQTGAPHKFLIVGVQRTGSSALAEMIDTHPDIAVGWEWTENTAYLRKLAQLQANLAGDFSALRPTARDHITQSLTENTQALGFRRLFGASHLWLGHPRLSAKLYYDRFGAHLNWLRRHPEVKLIHIIRHNHVGWIKSKFVTRAAGSFVGDTHPENMKVTVPLSEAVARVKSKVWIDGQLTKMQATNDYLAISYEDFAARLPGLAGAAAEFLGCDSEGIRPQDAGIRKQSTKPARDYIRNYDELQAAIAGALGA